MSAYACWIDGMACRSGEAQFGGIVIEAMESDGIQGQVD